MVNRWDASLITSRTPALIEFSGPLLADGTFEASSIMVNGTPISAAEGSLKARLFGSNGQQFGGVYRIFASVGGFSGAFLSQR
jgi:hypothetical protein